MLSRGYARRNNDWHIQRVGRRAQLVWHLRVGMPAKGCQRRGIPRQCVLTYQADSPSKCGVGGDGRKDRDGTFDQFHDSILPSEITEMLCLVLEERCDGLDTVAVLELGCKWVLG